MSLTCSFHHLQNKHKMHYSAMMSSTNTLKCQVNALLPGMYRIGVTLNKGRSHLYTIDACLTYDLVHDGGLISSDIPTEECTLSLLEASSVDSKSSLASQVHRRIDRVHPRVATTTKSTKVTVQAPFLFPTSFYQCLWTGETTYNTQRHEALQSTVFKISTSAIVTSKDVLTCPTPTVSDGLGPIKGAYLNISSAYGDTWGNSDLTFDFIPVITVIDVQPRVLDSDGGQLVVIKISPGAIPDLGAIDDGLMVYFDYMAVEAMRVGNNTLTCRAPTLGLHAVSISLGNRLQSLSTSMSVDVQPSSQYISLEPTLGSFHGNTNVTITVPFKLIDRFVSPTIKFGDIDANNLTINYDSMVTTEHGVETVSMYVLTPAVPLSYMGMLRVYLYDKQLLTGADDDNDETLYNLATEGVHEFYLGRYSYSRPADVAFITPSTVYRNRTITVGVQGSFFEARASLQCILNDGQWTVPARFIASHMISCTIPYTITGSSTLYRNSLTSGDSTNMSTIDIKVTNNGHDISLHSVSLLIKNNLVANYILPSQGFISGKTPVAIDLEVGLEGGGLRCRFGGVTSPITAYKVSTTRYICVSPPTRFAGTIDLEIWDETMMLGSTPFHYADQPENVTLSTSRILALGNDSFTIIADTGIESNSNISARLRHSSGELLSSGMSGCKTGWLSQQPMTKSKTIKDWGVVCWVVAPHSDIDSVYNVEISNNGIDWLANFVSVNVYQPMEVVVVEDLHLFSGGGNIITLTTTHTQMAVPMYCVWNTVHHNNNDMGRLGMPFLSNQEKIVYVDAIPSNRHDGGNKYSCVSPSLPAGRTSTFSVVQGHAKTHNKKRVLIDFLDVIVYPEPRVQRISPSSIVNGATTPILITFTTPIMSNLMYCLYGTFKSPMLYSSTDTGVCHIRPRQSGTNTTLSIGIGNSQNPMIAGMIDVYDRPSDVTLNASAIIEMELSYIQISSPSCSLPKAGLYCISTKKNDGSLIIPPINYNDGCSLTCVVTPTTMSQYVSFTVCPDGSNNDKHICSQPIYDTLLPVVKQVLITAISPHSGSIRGGNSLMMIGQNFENGNEYVCMFGAAGFSASVYIRNNKELICMGIPPYLPGEKVRVGLYSHGLSIGMAQQSYEYLPMLSAFNTSTNIISAQGGTIITLSTRELPSQGNRLFQCFIGTAYVDATVIDKYTLECLSPSLLEHQGSANLVITVDGSELSDVMVLQVVDAPRVVYHEPMTFKGSTSTIFSLMFDGSIDTYTAGHQDMVDGQLMVVIEGQARTSLNQVSTGILNKFYPTKIERDEYSDSMLYVTFAGLEPGTYNMTVRHLDYEVYRYMIVATTGSSIHRVSPLAAFHTSSTRLYIDMASSISQADRELTPKCCFQVTSNSNGIVSTSNIKTSFASLISASQWSCSLPRLMDQEMVMDYYAMSVGLMYSSSDACETSFFEFEIYRTPTVISLSHESGTLLGGTPLTLYFDKEVEHSAQSVPQFHCRIGYEIVMGHLHGKDSVLCVTPAHPVAGAFPLEISVNGRDFKDTGYLYQYLPLGVRDSAVSVDIATPAVYDVSPKYIPAGAMKIVHIIGSEITMGCECYVGSSIAVSSTIIDNTKMECVLPVHIPGKDFLTVVNSNGEASKLYELTFVTPAAVLHEAGGGCTPTYGPRTAHTSITVHGTNFDVANLDYDGLLCLIGDDWVFADQITATSLVCMAPPNDVSGKVVVKVATIDKEFLPGESALSDLAAG